MKDSERQIWPPNITVRNQIVAFLGGVIFILAWAYVVLKNYPYKIKEKTKTV